ALGLPELGVAGEAEDVVALLAEAPIADHQRPDQRREEPDQEQRARPVGEEPLRGEHSAPQRPEDPRDRQREGHQALGADQRLASRTRLSSLSSMVIRRFFDFASRTAPCSAGVKLSPNAGTSWAGVLSAWVQITTCSESASPYLWISWYADSARR